MTIEEAIVELGISAGASADQTRRAYLRLLKTRKPEVDPDGFRRLRDAYDLLREANATHVSVPHVEPEPPPPPQQEEEADPTAGQSIAAALEANDCEQAASIARQRLDFSCAHPNVPLLIEGPAIIELILRLQEDGHRKRARGVTRKLKRWFDITGSEMRVLTPMGAALFAMMRELAELPDEFPEAISRAFVQALRSGRADVAARALRRYRKKEGERAVEELRDLLEEHAPTFARNYARVIAPVVRPPPRSPFQYLRFLGVFPAYLVVMAILRAATAPDPPGPTAMPPELTFSIPSGKAHVSGLLRDAVGPASSLADKASQNGALDLAMKARELAHSLDRLTCQQGIASFKTIVEMVRALPPNQKTGLPVVVDVLRRAIGTACEVPVKDLP